MRMLTAKYVTVLVFVLAIVMIGCDDDSSTNSNGNNGDPDPLTPEQVQDELEALVAGIDEEAIDCTAGYLLDPEANEDILDYFSENILMPIVEGDPISGYYGTWVDESGNGSDGYGVKHYHVVPTDAIKVILEGVDTLGNDLEGYLLVDDITVDIDTTGGAIDVTLEMDASINETTTGDNMAMSVSLEVTAQLAPEGSDELVEDLTLDFDISGNVCALEYSMEMTMDLDEGMDMSGWYNYENETVNYLVDVDFAPDTTITASIWTGSAQNPDLGIYLQMTPSAEDCLDGHITINGHQQAEIAATGCGTDTMMVYIVVQDEWVPADEIFADLIELLEDIEIPLATRMSAMARPIIGMADVPRTLTSRSVWTRGARRYSGVLD
ncbi:MAG: hypothetical protein KAY32_04625 [Candidatus Eisenbacteria sp.]|nr:hypothetical protein [Candidatus Eisenbacteria bacterium]